jgi:hypothetical protein
MTFRTCDFDDVTHFRLDPLPAREGKGHWSNYPRGVAAGFMRAGHLLHRVDALVSTDIPIGGGLSSSAALEAATADVQRRSEYPLVASTELGCLNSILSDARCGKSLMHASADGSAINRISTPGSHLRIAIPP